MANLYASTIAYCMLANHHRKCLVKNQKLKVMETVEHYSVENANIIFINYRRKIPDGE
jgi:hypothetical protein